MLRLGTPPTKETIGDVVAGDGGDDVHRVVYFPRRDNFGSAVLTVDAPDASFDGSVTPVLPLVRGSRDASGQ